MAETTSEAPLKPANPAFEEVVRASFSRQGMMGTLGAFLVAVEPGRTLIELPYSTRFSQQQGAFHGGVIGAIADSAGGYAALSLQPAGTEVATVEYKINFLKMATGSLLRAEGRIIRAGRSVSVARADVTCIGPAGEQLCALMQATFVPVSASGT